MSSPTSPTKAPLAIEDKPHNEMEPGVTTMNVDGIAVKLDALGPMIINTDGVSWTTRTSRRKTSSGDVHP